MNETVAVVGGGIAGCAAAGRLARGGARVTVFDERPRLGGRVETCTALRGLPVELGAVFLFPLYRQVAEALRDLGLADDLEHAPRRVAFVQDGRGAVVRGEYPVSYLGLPFLSMRDRAVFVREAARLAVRRPPLDLFDPGSLAAQDAHTMAQWAEERLTPALYHSLIRPLFEPYFFFSGEEASAALAQAYLGQRSSLRYQKLRGGNEALCAGLARGAEVIAGAEVKSVTPGRDHGVTVSWTGPGAGEAVFDAAVVAVPAPVADELTPDVPLSTADRTLMRSQRYAPMAHAAFVTGDVDLGGGAGAVVPCGPGHHPVRLVGSNAALSPRRDTGIDVVSVYLDASEAEAGDDDRLAERAWDGARALCPRLPRTAELLTLRRWRFAGPVPEVGRYGAVAAFEHGADTPVAFAGDWLSVGGLEGAMQSGLNAAERVLARRRARDHTAPVAGAAMQGGRA